MDENFIDISNFDKIFNQILAIKKGKNVVYSRMILDDLGASVRVHFIVDYVNSFKRTTGLTYKMLFWEDDLKIVNAFNEFTNLKNHVKIHRSYKNTEIPGEIFYSEKIVNEILLRGLISMHFNFEHAIEPSFNARLQICINRENNNILLDIYDDRGCDVYFLYK